MNSGESPKFDAAVQMRQMALECGRDWPRTDPKGRTQLVGLVTDWTIDPDATSTVVCMVDGSVSLYVSGGQSIIGCGEHASVRDAAHAALVAALKVQSLFKKTTDHPLPPLDHMRFAMVTTDGAQACTAPCDALRRGDHPAADLAGMIQRVIHEIHRATGDKDG